MRTNDLIRIFRGLVVSAMIIGTVVIGILFLFGYVNYKSNIEISAKFIMESRA